MANSKILDQLRGSMPEDVKYVTVERCPNMMAVDVFFLFGEKWYVARKIDYESIYNDAAGFWNGHFGEFGKFSVETDDEPPKRWAAANEVAQNLLSHFKLGEEFCDHVGWSRDPVSKFLSLQEQEELSGKILEFIKPLLMKEADVPFPRRLPLPTVACSECGPGVEVRRHDDPKGSISFDGHLEHMAGHSLVRCYKCPPKIGPIVCDGGPVEVEKPENLKLGVTRVEWDAVGAFDGNLEHNGPVPEPLKLLPQNEDVWEAEKKAALANGYQARTDAERGKPITMKEAKCDPGPVEVPEPFKPGFTRIELGRIGLDELKPITMDDCLEGAKAIGASGGCTCGAWVTPGARHDDHCDLAE